jgi:hypothetical protein
MQSILAPSLAPRVAVQHPPGSSLGTSSRTSSSSTRSSPPKQSIPFRRKSQLAQTYHMRRLPWCACQTCQPNTCTRMRAISNNSCTSPHICTLASYSDADVMESTAAAPMAPTHPHAIYSQPHTHPTSVASAEHAAATVASAITQQAAGGNVLSINHMPSSHHNQVHTSANMSHSSAAASVPPYSHPAVMEYVAGEIKPLHDQMNAMTAAMSCQSAQIASQFQQMMQALTAATSPSPSPIHTPSTPTSRTTTHASRSPSASSISATSTLRTVPSPSVARGTILPPLNAAPDGAHASFTFRSSSPSAQLSSSLHPSSDCSQSDTDTESVSSSSSARKKRAEKQSTAYNRWKKTGEVPQALESAIKTAWDELLELNNTVAKRLFYGDGSKVNQGGNKVTQHAHALPTLNMQRASRVAYHVYPIWHVRVSCAHFRL